MLKIIKSCHFQNKININKAIKYIYNYFNRLYLRYSEG